MSTTRRVVSLAVIALLAAGAYTGIRAFQPPLSLAKLESVKPGMSPSQVREILGTPTREYPSQSYEVKGVNYQTGAQWTYQRFLTFGCFNVLFDTNGTVAYGHYETF